MIIMRFDSTIYNLGFGILNQYLNASIFETSSHQLFSSSDSNVVKWLYIADICSCPFSYYFFRLVSLSENKSITASMTSFFVNRGTVGESHCASCIGSSFLPFILSLLRDALSKATCSEYRNLLLSQASCTGIPAPNRLWTL